MGFMNFTICGLDEAGRGALAGPLVIAAVTLPKNFTFKKIDPKIVIRDSKTMSHLQRQKAFVVIQRYALNIQTQIISVEEINTLGIHVVNKTGFVKLINNLEADEFIVDGRWNFSEINKNVKSVIDADATHLSAICAGIIAKQTRDSIMFDFHQDCSLYGWDRNKGYGTKEHLNALNTYGIHPNHRTKFVETALRKSSKLS